MSTFAIKVENLSKKYRLGEYGIGTLVDDLNRRIKKPVRFCSRVS